MTTLSILCPGPSLQELEPETLAGSYVMAVNFAVRHEPTRHLIDAWITFDPMDMFERHVGEIVRSIPGLRREKGNPNVDEIPEPLALAPLRVVLCPEPSPILQGWRYGEDSERGVIYSNETEKSVLEVYGLNMPQTWALPTTVLACCWGGRRTFERINLYGCDMQGYSSPLTPWEPWRPDAEIERWPREAAMLGAVMDKYRDEKGEPRIHRLLPSGAPMG